MSVFCGFQITLKMRYFLIDQSIRERRGRLGLALARFSVRAMKLGRASSVIRRLS
jgi:hypothetical protein